MSLPITIRGSNGFGHEAQVTADGGLLCAVYDAELRDLGDQKNCRRFYSDYFKTAAGSSQMAVSGSAASPVIFTIGSDTFTSNGVKAVPRAKAIRTIRVILEGPGLDPTVPGELRAFGPIAAPGMANGLNLNIYQGPFKTSWAPAPVKTLWDFIKFAGSFSSYPSALAQTVDGAILNFPITDPIIIGFGATDTLEIVVQDDLSGFTSIQVLAQGWYELATD